MRDRTRWRFVVTAAALAAGCADHPAPVAPGALRQLPPFTVVFVAPELAVEEGETARIRIRYRVLDLDEAARVGIRALADTAAEEDFSLLEDSVELPAGRGIEGEVSVELRAVADSAFAEGEETLTLRFEADPGAPGGTLGDGLRVEIRDAGVEPCPGIRLLAARPVWLDEPDRYLTTTLDLTWPEDGGGSRIEFLGPYAAPRSEDANARFRVDFVSWNVRESEAGILHSLEIEWAGGEGALDFALTGADGCPETEASCSAEGCATQIPP